jgi:hypothetical protein
MMMDEFSTPDVVEQHRQLNRLIKAAICDREDHELDV